MSAPDDGRAPPVYPPLDRSSPQLTVRAVLTGMVLGGVLSLCNVYAGLKVGWGFNMSITAALLAFGLWSAARAARAPAFGLLENNINQTAASSAASISSAGLVAPIPALTILTGYQFTWTTLVIWTFFVCVCGIVVAVGLRRQMLITDALPFPSGVAAAETLERMYARGSQAMRQVWTLMGAGLFSAALKLALDLLEIPKAAVPGSFAAAGATRVAGLSKITLNNLTFAFDPSVLLFAVGAIVGVRAGASMLLGAVVAYGWLGPHALAMGWAEAGAPDVAWFGSLNKWLLWPGVAMMVTASLTSFAFSWRSVVAAIRGVRHSVATDEPSTGEDVPRRVFVGALAVALVATSIAQVVLFGIGLGTAVLGVLLTFLLAIVAGRVAGETGITPVGAMGKVSQLAFGVLSPGDATSNLMTANVTGGAASQCADLLHDLKTGLMVGASPRKQFVAQLFGALAGALAGSAGYLAMIPDPAHQLFGDEWPAPAVATWRAVAELFMRGFEAMPAGAPEAIVVAGSLGILLAVLEKTLPNRVAAWLPSPSAAGLAFVIPAYNSMSMFAGGLTAFLLLRHVRSWAARYVIVIAAGLIAGESLAGVGLAIQKVLTDVAGG